MAGPLDKSGIIEFFLVEAGEHLQNLNKGLLSLEKDSNDTAMIDELFRAAHTLKGSAAMMGFQGVSDVAHKAEDMLSQFRSGTIPICKETLNFLFDSVDAVKVMVDGVANNQSEDPLVVESIGRAYKDVVESIIKIASTTSSKEDEPFGVSQEPIPVAADHEHDADLDLDWEKTFEVDSENLRTFEPLPEEPANSQQAIIPPRTSVPSSGVQQPASSPTPSAVPDGPLRQELEEAKKIGILEKRGTGRRAKDAVDLEKQFIRVNIDRLDNLMNLVGEMIVNRNRLARQVDLIKALREELEFSQNRLLHEIKKFEEKYEYTLSIESAGAKQEATEPSTDFLELEFDRYDDFNLLSRKLTEITNATNEIMTQLAGFFDSFQFDRARISTITTNLQDEITMARMVEVDKLYQMFQRPVRDIAQEENKKVNMVVSGGETKIDKTIFEIISDPLMHMIRNAISHGIETVPERRAAGKDPTGSLIMKARHEGNSIIIEIEDDGRGMDPAVLRHTAVDKGFMSAAEAQSLTDSESINLIFRPGFSTASKISKVSGRGVGMDVVSTHLARINGRIVIRFEKNVGTKFLIRLPLTLAIRRH